jgi:Skp family chaperone for outer membrane proteins
MAAPTTSPDDALYALPLEAFVGERTRLAAELRRAGDRATAAAIAKAGKPTVSAWAVNQLARREADAVHRLADASAGLRQAQLNAGPGGREAFVAASAAHRAAMADLRLAAQRILEGGGHAVTPAVLERIARNLRAMVTSDELAREIQAGRLVRDLPVESFGDLASLASAAPGLAAGGAAPRPPPTPADAAPRAAAADAKARAAAAARTSEEARRLARARRDHQAEVARLAGAADQAKARVARALASAERARRAAHEAEDELRHAEAAAEQARQRLAAARSALDPPS